MHRVVALFVAGVALSGCGGASTTTSPSPATETTTPPATSTAAARPALVCLGFRGTRDTDTGQFLRRGVGRKLDVAGQRIRGGRYGQPGQARGGVDLGRGQQQPVQGRLGEGSGAAGVRDQLLRSSGADGAARTAAQSVILFDTPARASAFVDSSAEKWPLCREFSGADSTSTVGEVATDDGVVRATITATNAAGDTVTCRRALTAANNAVIEASACGAAAPDAAVAIVREIAAKANG